MNMMKVHSEGRERAGKEKRRLRREAKNEWENRLSPYIYVVLNRSGSLESDRFGLLL